MLNSEYSVLFEGTNLMRLMAGLFVSARIAFISILIGSALGVGMGVLRTIKSKPLNLLLRLYLELFRIIPILVWLFIFYFGVTTAFNLNISGEVVSIIVFTLWGAAEMGDIVRGSLESLPRHQIESGRSIGLSFTAIYRYVLLPQSARRMVPATINLATRMIKTTSLVVLIGVIDVVKVGQQIIEVSILKAPAASFWVYGFIFILYFMLCYPLSKLSKKLEIQWQN